VDRGSRVGSAIEGLKIAPIKADDGALTGLLAACRQFRYEIRYLNIDEHTIYTRQQE
jgi:hypothetical protein